MNFCRLCLGTVSNTDLKEIGNQEIKMLGSLLIDMNLNTTKKYIICDYCLTKLDVLYKFKSMCLSTENYVPPLIKTEPLTDQTDLPQVCKKEKDSDDLFEKPDNQKKCRLCLKFNIEIGSILSDSDENEDSVLYMISRCIPEVDMGVTKKQIVCKSCYNSLKDYISFMNKCIETENRVDYFCHINGIDKTDGLDLLEVIKFKSKEDILMGKATDIYNTLVKDKIKIEKNEEHHEPPVFVKSEPVDVKLEPRYEEDTDIAKNYLEMQQAGLYHTIFFPPPFTSMYNNFEDTTNVDGRPLSKTEMLACEFCNFTTKSEKILRNHIMLHDRSFICHTCGFRFRRKSHLLKHLWRPEHQEDEQTYKCHICFFMTKYKNCMLYHQKTHDLDEKTKFKCDMCNLQTPNRRYLNRHLLTHKDYSETILYRCDLCPYVTKQKFFLRSHVNKHAAPKFECDLCPYKAKYSSCLRRHKTRWHKDDSEKRQFICYFCGYNTFDRDAIVRHLQTHRDQSNLHKCDFCDFQTGLKEVFRRHMGNHINPDRKPDDLEKPFQCDMCEYKTEFQSNLAGHKLVHRKQDPPTFKCDTCTYTTDKKSSLRRHNIIHTDRERLQCGACEYQTFSKNSLANHMLKHKDPSEVEKFKCPECEYVSTNKDNYRMHVKRHRDRSEKKIYKCQMCDYESDLLNYYRKHLRNKHKMKYKGNKLVDIDIPRATMSV